MKLHAIVTLLLLIFPCLGHGGTDIEHTLSSARKFCKENSLPEEKVKKQRQVLIAALKNEVQTLSRQLDAIASRPLVACLTGTRYQLTSPVSGRIPEKRLKEISTERRPLEFRKLLVEEFQRLEIEHPSQTIERFEPRKTYDLNDRLNIDIALNEAIAKRCDHIRKRPKVLAANIRRAGGDKTLKQLKDTLIELNFRNKQLEYVKGSGLRFGNSEEDAKKAYELLACPNRNYKSCVLKQRSLLDFAIKDRIQEATEHNPDFKPTANNLYSYGLKCLKGR